MIIKRTTKSEMPNLKRRMDEEEDNEEEEEDNVAGAKKRKMKMKRNNSIGLFSLPDDHEGTDDFSSGSGSWCSEESSYWGNNSDVLSNSNLSLNNSRRLNNGSSVALENNGSSERMTRRRLAGPALLRSSRGRPQMLPSRFSDSVIGRWKNRGIKVEEEDSSFEDDNCVVEGRKGIRNGNNRNGNKYGSKQMNYYDVEEEEEESGFDDFDERKFSNSFSSTRTRMSVNESYTSGLSFEGVDRKMYLNNGKRKDLYKPEDFALGDIVWAKCGKRYPAWPAVVIDPFVQAPKSVLSCVVPGAICVMFYGYSKNGTQRVHKYLYICL